MTRTGCILLSTTICIMATSTYGQSVPVPDSLSIFSQPITLDTFVIRSNFDVQTFVRRTRADTTFYKAFRSMHLVPYRMRSDIQAYNSNREVIATQRTTGRQEINNRCRTMVIEDQQTTGDYYKRNGDNNYYTTSLFDYLFITRQPVCNEDDIVAGKMDMKGKGKLERNKHELKQMIFNPGHRIQGIPLMPDRASIYEEDEARKYDFRISLTELDGQMCYRFRITPKKGYEDKLIYKELTTWFRQRDYAILARNYALTYSNILYDFDVAMKVRTTEISGKIYPVSIEYRGDWHIFTKKRERVDFDVNITY